MESRYLESIKMKQALKVARCEEGSYMDLSFLQLLSHIIKESNNSKIVFTTCVKLFRVGHGHSVSPIATLEERIRMTEKPPPGLR